MLSIFNGLTGNCAVNLLPNWGATPVWRSRLREMLNPGETFHTWAELWEAPRKPASLYFETDNPAFSLDYQTFFTLAPNESSRKLFRLRQMDGKEILFQQELPYYPGIKGLRFRESGQKTARKKLALRQLLPDETIKLVFLDVWWTDRKILFSEQAPDDLNPLWW